MSTMSDLLHAIKVCEDRRESETRRVGRTMSPDDALYYRIVAVYKEVQSSEGSLSPEETEDLLGSEPSVALLMVPIRPNPDDAPTATVRCLQEYIDHGVPPGGFVQAILEDKLVESFCLADSINLASMHHIMAWLYFKAPMACRGSAEKVSAWLKMHAEERKDATNETIQPGDGTPPPRDSEPPSA